MQRILFCQCLKYVALTKNPLQEKKENNHKIIN